MNATLQTLIANSTKHCANHLKHNVSSNSKHSDHKMDHHHSGHHTEGSAHGSAHGGSHDMSFHLRTSQTILFDFWKTENISMFIVSCLVLIAVAALYEGLKLARELLIKREILKLRSSVLENITSPVKSHCHCNKAPNDTAIELVNAQKNVEGCDGDHEVFISSKSKHKCCCNSLDRDSKVITCQSYSLELFSTGHLTQTMLHMVQITVSYMLMLVFMTYNVWLCLSVVLGTAIGFFIFGSQRLTSIDVNEHCQ